ncbi:MAG: alpha/beta hydrolase, partial [Pseudomonadota bacterium]
MADILAYETFGDSRKPALMLLHGFMSSNGQWLLNREALAEHYYLVMVELWGHGNSPTPDDVEQYSLNAYLQQFENIRETIGVEVWGVIGQSYGAGLIIKYALNYPARCPAIIVTNSRSAFGQLTSAGGENRRPSFDDPDFSLRKLPYHPIHARRFPDFVKNALVEKADVMSTQAVEHGGRLGTDLNA